MSDLFNSLKFNGIRIPVCFSCQENESLVVPNWNRTHTKHIKEWTSDF